MPRSLAPPVIAIAQRRLKGDPRRSITRIGGSPVYTRRAAINGDHFDTVPSLWTAAATDRELLMKSPKISAIVLAVAVAGLASVSVVRADETQAKSLLKGMSDYLAAQRAISFDSDSNLEIVSTQQQKVGLASSGTLILNRPDKLRATRTGGFANVEMVFDGKTLTIAGQECKSVRSSGSARHDRSIGRRVAGQVSGLSRAPIC